MVSSLQFRNTEAARKAKDTISPHTSLYPCHATSTRHIYSQQEQEGENQVLERLVTSLCNRVTKKRTMRCSFATKRKHVLPTTPLCVLAATAYTCGHARHQRYGGPRSFRQETKGCVHVVGVTLRKESSKGRQQVTLSPHRPEAHSSDSITFPVPFVPFVRACASLSLVKMQ